jgi:hypothetical protein
MPPPYIPWVIKNAVAAAIQEVNKHTVEPIVKASVVMEAAKARVEELGIKAETITTKAEESASKAEQNASKAEQTGY